MRRRPAHRRAPGASVDVATMQVPGQAIAIEARATLQADDVREAVDRITSTVTTHGGRVAAADIDYAPPAEDGGGRRLPRHARVGGPAR